MGKNEVGVFLTCTGIRDPEKALAAVQELGLRVAQIQSRQLPDHFYSKEGARKFVDLLEKYRVEASAVCIVHEGERYHDWETVVKTVGYLPPETLLERLEYSKRCVDFAADIDTPLVTTHMGILPKDPSTPGYQRLLKAVREVASYCQNRGVTLALETGQETGTELLEFMNLVREDVKVNFDGANLILYGLDDPLEALDTLKDLVVHVHAKDGVPPARSGLLGREAPLGKGKAEVCETVRRLVKFGYAGPFILETYVWREHKTDPLFELRKGKAFIENCLEDNFKHPSSK